MDISFVFTMEKDHKDLDDKIKFNFDIKEAYYTNPERRKDRRDQG